jgi:hypothetical protein
MTIPFDRETCENVWAGQANFFTEVKNPENLPLGVGVVVVDLLND